MSMLYGKLSSPHGMAVTLIVICRDQYIIDGDAIQRGGSVVILREPDAKIRSEPITEARHPVIEYDRKRFPLRSNRRERLHYLPGRATVGADGDAVKVASAVRKPKPRIIRLVAQALRLEGQQNVLFVRKIQLEGGLGHRIDGIINTVIQHQVTLASGGREIGADDDASVV